MIDDKKALRAVMTWGSGHNYLGATPATGAAVVMVEDPDHVRSIAQSDVLGEEGVLLSPASLGPLTNDSIDVIPYEMDRSEPSGEIRVNEDIYVQHQDYSTALYMSVIGPTILRVMVREDYDALLADLDNAVELGKFPDYLCHPATVIADEGALSAAVIDEGPRTRLHLRQDASWSVGPFGLTLGVLGDSFQALEASWRVALGGPASVPLAGVVAESYRVTSMGARPWISDALAAVSTLRELATRGITDVQVSGFGARLNPAIPLIHARSHVGPSPTPVLAWTDTDAYLHLPHRTKTFRMTHTVGRAFEAVLATDDRLKAEQFAPADMVQAVIARLAREGVQVEGADGKWRTR